MRTPTKEHTRAERLREHAAVVEQTRRVVDAMGLFVRGREARAKDGETLLEVEFAQLDVEGRALPASVWVALRRGDVEAALDAMTAASRTQFLVEEREEMGQGFRLQTVQETLPLPEADLLTAQLSRALSVPQDVLTVIAEWGPDDPRALSEIEDLLTRRFGPGPRREPVAAAEPVTVVEESTDPAGRLTMSVADAAQVLRLDPDQVRALTVLVTNATVTLTLA